MGLFVTGQIDTTGGGAKLSYRWSHSGKLGPVKETATNANGSAHVSTSFEVKRPPKPNGGGNPQMKLLNPDQAQTGWVELHVLPQGQTDWSQAKISNRSRWKVKCDPLPKRAKPPVTPKPGTPKAVLAPGAGAPCPAPAVISVRHVPGYPVTLPGKILRPPMAAGGSRC